MGIVCRSSRIVVLASALFFLSNTPGFSWEGVGRILVGIPDDQLVAPIRSGSVLDPSQALATGIGNVVKPLSDVLVKVAYGRTFGTSTDLDYATVEVSKRVSRRPIDTSYGSTIGELQLAMLASYILYYEGNVERVKKLDFRDGYELAWIPKGKITFPGVFLGMVPYGECGAGMSYVSETYRNSGSRFNWSLLGGFGMERRMTNRALFALGFQWRHLSNGNMWGQGDELHNSNSGTDMIQALATVLHVF